MEPSKSRICTSIWISSLYHNGPSFLPRVAPFWVCRQTDEPGTRLLVLYKRCLLTMTKSPTGCFSFLENAILAFHRWNLTFVAFISPFHFPPIDGLKRTFVRGSYRPLSLSLSFPTGERYLAFLRRLLLFLSLDTQPYSEVAF